MFQFRLILTATYKRARLVRVMNVEECVVGNAVVGGGYAETVAFTMDVWNTISAVLGMVYSAHSVYFHLD